MSVEEARLVARFLQAHPPFDALDASAVERMAAAAELEALPAGTTIFSQGAGPVSHLRVVRSGAVEIVADGRVLDLLGEGELFGHASMLSGFPTGFEARTAEDTVCYRIEAGVAQRLLSAPAGLRFVARSLMEAPTELHELARQPGRNRADQPVAALVHGEPVVCGPQTTIRAAAERMTASHQTSVVVTLADGVLGILTDRDLRTRVVAAGLSVEAPVTEAMSAPAYTCTADQSAGEVLIQMLDKGLRHLPVVSSRGTVLGVVEDMDLVAVRTRSSFYLRQRVAEARSAAELEMVARELRPMVMALHDAHVGATNAMAVYSVVIDGLTRRALELELGRQPDAAAPVEFAWLALGSQARREALPSSDVDSAVVWFGDEESETVRDRLLEIAPRSRPSWSAAACGSTSTAPALGPGIRPSGQLVAASGAQLDRRAHPGEGADPGLGGGRQPPGLGHTHGDGGLRHLPPGHGEPGPAAAAGSLRAVAPAADRLLPRPGGRAHRRAPRPAGPQAGRRDPDRRTRPVGGDGGRGDERLHHRAAAGRGRRGNVAAADAHTLIDAFELINNLRLGHQVDQLRAGLEPDDTSTPRS